MFQAIKRFFTGEVQIENDPAFTAAIRQIVEDHHVQRAAIERARQS